MALKLLILAVLLLSLSCNFFTVVQSQQSGKVGLWSDSACNSYSSTSNFGEPDPIALNYTLDPDTCLVPGATVHSYRVRQNATCANGTTAEFQYWTRANCTADPTDEDTNPPQQRGIKRRAAQQTDSDPASSLGLGSDPQLSGECLALIAFDSLAFICEGVETSKEAKTIISTSASPSTAGTASTQIIAPFPTGTAGVSGNYNTSRPTAASSPILAGHDGSSSDLSAGASVGVGIGTAVGVLGAAAILFVSLRIYKSQNAPKTPSERGLETEVGDRPMSRNILDGINVHETGPGLPREIKGNAIHEGDGSEIHEMGLER